MSKDTPKNPQRSETNRQNIRKRWGEKREYGGQVRIFADTAELVKSNQKPGESFISALDRLIKSGINATK